VDLLYVLLAVEGYYGFGGVEEVGLELRMEALEGAGDLLLLRF
jgi:hypothetical protein